MSVTSLTAGVEAWQKLAPPAPEPLLIDVSEAARLCGCSTRHFRRLVDSGRAPRALKLGNLLRFRADEIREWVAGGCKAIRSAGRPAQ